MGETGRAVIAIISSVVGLSVLAVLFSARSNTAGVLGAAGGALANVIGAATSPVTGAAPAGAVGYGVGAGLSQGLGAGMSGLVSPAWGG